jgi:hypothetical protein
MSDNPLPSLTWTEDVPGREPASVAHSVSSDDEPDPVGPDADAHAFRWPTPPFASYPLARTQLDHEPCEIVGLNGRVMHGRLIFSFRKSKLPMCKCRLRAPPCPCASTSSGQFC